MAYPFILYL